MLWSKLAYMELKERVRTARKTARLTQEALAEAIGVSRPAITQWEDGTVKSLDAGNAVRAARILGVDELWLATGEGHPYSVKDEPYPLPPDLSSAWQRLTPKLRDHLLAIAKALAKVKETG